MEKHEDILKGMYGQLKGLFDTSDQAMYIYQDDSKKACNDKFASMLGYGSAEEWAAVEENFPTAFVSEKSQNTLIGAYQDAMEKGTGASIEVEWKKKSKGTVRTNVILVPIEYGGHRMALHFVSRR